jgi:hypothetical protein
MSEEALAVIEDSAEEPQEESTIEIDETPQAVKDLAKELGWNENRDDNPDKYVDAKTFILKSREINSSLRRQVKEITNVVSELKTHNERVYQAEVKRLTQEMNELRAQRKEAIEEGDVAKVEKIETQIDEIKEKTLPQPKNQTNPVFDEWLEENQWYRNDTEMREFADRIGREYEGLPFDKILKLVRKDVQSEFPDKFAKKSTRSYAPTVESGVRRSSSVRSRSESDLTPAQRNIMNQFAKHGVMTKTEYIADLIKRGEI